MLVVDANVIVYSVFQTAEAPLVANLQQVDADWRVPSLWKHEVASAAATFVRARQANVQQARTAVQSALHMLANREIEIDLPASVEIALALDLSAYDAQYLLLAQVLSTRCVTADQKMLRQAPGLTIALADFTSTP